MAYESGITSNVHDLLDKIRVAALAQGWIVNHSGESPIPALVNHNYLALQNGTSYFNLISNIVDARLYGDISSNYAGSGAWDDNANKSYRAYSGDIGNNIPYTIFTTNTSISVVIEPTVGVFSFILLGKLVNKFGNVMGGEYITMTKPKGTYDVYPPASVLFSGSAVLHAEVDGQIYFDMYENKQPNPNNLGLNNHLSRETWCNYTPNQFNLVAPMQPLILYVDRGAGLTSPVGEVENMRIINIQNFNSRDNIVIGPDTWEVYSSRGEHVDNIGYAFKKS